MPRVWIKTVTATRPTDDPDIANQCAGGDVKEGLRGGGYYGPPEAETYYDHYSCTEEPIWDILTQVEYGGRTYGSRRRYCAKHIPKAHRFVGLKLATVPPGEE